MPMQPGKGYDPDQTCGDFGGRTLAGRPCQQPAGWKSQESDDGRCHQHDRAAEAYVAAKKAEVIELLPTTPFLKDVCKTIGLTERAIYDWRQADPKFREAFESIVEVRDKSRAAQVEDKVFERIMADKASPAETIFFLKNRDPDRWKEQFTSVRDRTGTTPDIPSVDSARAKLSKKLKHMARRAAEATRQAEELDRDHKSDVQSLTDRLQREVEKQEDDADGA